MAAAVPFGKAATRIAASLSRRGLDLIARLAPPRIAPASAVADKLAAELLSVRGEASGVALATRILEIYASADDEQRRAFLAHLAEHFDPDPEVVATACRAYSREGAAALPRLSKATEAPRQELFRRLNLAPGGTAALVALRADLLRYRATMPALDRVDIDLAHLFHSWFNRGFLKMRAIGWDAPASLLERIMRYEAVHDIGDWNDLRSRLAPDDRRCFGFFHPALPDDPLIFMEVALTCEIPASIQRLLDIDRVPIAADEADAAVFYSISNCHDGLRGISLGHFLIKQVAEDLRRGVPNLRHFVTLSPIPGLMKWRDAHIASPDQDIDTLLGDAIDYLLGAKARDGRPLDPVARFHLGNGARLERLNSGADLSAKGMAQSGGLMVNYRYDLVTIEANHEAYVEDAAMIVGPGIQSLARRLGRTPTMRLN